MNDPELSQLDWRLVPEESRPGPLQMALDETAAETAAAGGPCTVRVYRWEPSCLSLGYHQDPDTVDWEFCRREGIDVTRRQTGGGGIYHDSWGDISYSIAVPAESVPGDLLDCYHLLCEPVLAALSRMGVDAGFADEERSAIHQPACYLRELHPAHDVVVDGRKLSGNAQYRRHDAVIQHGSITFESLPGRHLETFTNPETSAATFRERTTDVASETDRSGGITRADAVETLEESLAEWVGATAGSWTDDELERARKRVDEKYAADSWVREREAPRT